ncbi:MAG: methyltransferase family protein [Promethearchaeota archaeon]
MRMNNSKGKFKHNLTSIATSITSFLVPILQYVPCTGVWFGIMSVPFLSYLALFFQNPRIILSDFEFLFGSHGIYIIIFGLIFYIYSLIYQLTHRKQLIKTGPYRYLRHPQYLAFIIMTLGMTLITFQTSPIFNFELSNIDPYSLLLYFWIGEVIAYIILGKIEDFALKAKYGDEFLEYVHTVPFFVPFFKLDKIRSNKNNS